MDFKELNLYKAEHYATSESEEREPRDGASEGTKPLHRQDRIVLDWTRSFWTGSFWTGPDRSGLDRTPCCWCFFFVAKLDACVQRQGLVS